MTYLTKLGPLIWPIFGKESGKLIKPLKASIDFIYRNSSEEYFLGRRNAVRRKAQENVQPKTLVVFKIGAYANLI